MVVKCNKTISNDDLSYWNIKKSFNNNELENVDDEEGSIALSVSLLLKNKDLSRPNLLNLPSHLITSSNCQCHRLFHIFCTDLFNENNQDIEMINIHPAPHNHERDSSRRILAPFRKYPHRYQEDNDQDTFDITRTEPCQITIPENQLFEKKLRVPLKHQSRTMPSNIPVSYHNFKRSSLQTPLKYSSSIRIPKQSTSMSQLQIRTLSVFDEVSSRSQLFYSQVPPPSPKTPTKESSMLLLNSIIQPPFRAISITPCIRNSNENEKKLINISSSKITNYKDHAKEYLSNSNYSVNNKDDDDDDNKDIDKVLTTRKPKVPVHSHSLSRQGKTLRERLLSHNANHYISLAEVYYSSLDVYKNLTEKSRRPLKIQTPANENDDRATIITKTTTKTASIPQLKSVFGFSKTASSMHFGHAAGRLGLQASFEKWPQPLSRRTPIERKQEVTTLRLVTLPLVTS